MMLNGRMTNEAHPELALEPLYSQLTGAKVDLDQAIKTVYLEIMTRVPTPDEIAEAKDDHRRQTAGRNGRLGGGAA